jgi:hypothetical protein
MHSQLNEVLARARMAELSRGVDRRANHRGALRIKLDARRARRENPAG